jgi:hypothetical protein
VFVLIPNSSATEVADIPEFKMWRTVRSRIPSVNFELLLGMASHLLGFYPYDITQYPLRKIHTSPTIQKSQYGFIMKKGLIPNRIRPILDEWCG